MAFKAKRFNGTLEKLGTTFIESVNEIDEKYLKEIDSDSLDKSFGNQFNFDKYRLIELELTTYYFLGLFKRSKSVLFSVEKDEYSKQLEFFRGLSEKKASISIT